MRGETGSKTSAPLTRNENVNLVAIPYHAFGPGTSSWLGICEPRRSISILLTTLLFRLSYYAEDYHFINSVSSRGSPPPPDRPCRRRRRRHRCQFYTHHHQLRTDNWLDGWTAAFRPTAIMFSHETESINCIYFRTHRHTPTHW